MSGFCSSQKPIHFPAELCRRYRLNKTLAPRPNPDIFWALVPQITRGERSQYHSRRCGGSNRRAVSQEMNKTGGPSGIKCCPASLSCVTQFSPELGLGSFCPTVTPCSNPHTSPLTPPGGPAGWQIEGRVWACVGGLTVSQGAPGGPVFCAIWAAGRSMKKTGFDLFISPSASHKTDPRNG